MQTCALGSSGLTVSVVGLGCNSLNGRIDMAASRAVVQQALDAGITFFDTANSYGNRYGTIGGSEIALGETLGARRKDIVLATKFGCQSHKHPSIPVEGASRQEIHAALHASLKRLKTDWIDLYQVHHPDPKTPVEETLRTLEDLRRDGLIRAAGCSNFPAWRIADAACTAKYSGVTGFATCQLEYSLLARGPEREQIPALLHYGMGLLPYYPLAAGLLTGKYRGTVPADGRLATQKRLGERFMTQSRLQIVERLAALAESCGRTLLELAFGWLRAQPAVSCIIAGATRPEQVAANVAAAQWRPDSETINKINEILAAAG